MTRNYKKKEKPWNEENMGKALEVAKGMSLRKAAPLYEVNWKTLGREKKRRESEGPRCGQGREPELSDEIEDDLAQRFMVLLKGCFYRCWEDYQDIVQQYLQREKISTKRFTDDRPGIEWMRSFFKRKMTLSLKKLRLMKDRSTDDPFRVYDFYDRLEELIQEKKLSPNQIWMCAEYKTPSDPKSCTIVTAGEKTVYEIDWDAQQNSALVVGNAAGTALGPLIVFKSEKLNLSWKGDTALPGTFCDCSNTGSMTDKIFSKWFSKFTVSVKERPLLLVVFYSELVHLSLEVIELALEEDITLLVMPRDLWQELFDPLSTEWEAKMNSWVESAGPEQVMGDDYLVKKLSGIWHDCWSEKNVKVCFEDSGIFPVDRDAYPAEFLNQKLLKKYNDARFAASENHLSRCVLFLYENCFHCAPRDCLDMVQRYLQAKKISTPFKDDRPGWDWFRTSLRKRNSSFCRKVLRTNYARKPEGNFFAVNDFYDRLEEVIQEKKLSPNQIWLWSENAFGYNSGSCTRRKVENISTALFVCNAAGGGLDPPITFTSEELNPTWKCTAAPPGTFYTFSDSGFMTVEVFFTCLLEFAAIVKERPLLVMYGGELEHISLEVIELALTKEITLIKLPPYLWTKSEIPICEASAYKLRLWRKFLGPGQWPVMAEADFVNEISKIWHDCFSESFIKSFFNKDLGLFPVNRDAYPVEWLNPKLRKKYNKARLAARKFEEHEGNDASSSISKGPEVTSGISGVEDIVDSSSSSSISEGSEATSDTYDAENDVDMPPSSEGSLESPEAISNTSDTENDVDIPPSSKGSLESPEAISNTCDAENDVDMPSCSRKFMTSSEATSDAEDNVDTSPSSKRPRASLEDESSGTSHAEDTVDKPSSSTSDAGVNVDKPPSSKRLCASPEDKSSGAPHAEDSVDMLPSSSISEGSKATSGTSDADDDSEAISDTSDAENAGDMPSCSKRPRESSEATSGTHDTEDGADMPSSSKRPRQSLEATSGTPDAEDIFDNSSSSKRPPEKEPATCGTPSVPPEKCMCFSPPSHQVPGYKWKLVWSVSKIDKEN